MFVCFLRRKKKQRPFLRSSWRRLRPAKKAKWKPSCEAGSWTQLKVSEQRLHVSLSSVTQPRSSFPKDDSWSYLVPYVTLSHLDILKEPDRNYLRISGWIFHVPYWKLFLNSCTPGWQANQNPSITESLLETEQFLSSSYTQTQLCNHRPRLWAVVELSCCWEQGPSARLAVQEAVQISCRPAEEQRGE